MLRQYLDRTSVVEPSLNGLELSERTGLPGLRLFHQLVEHGHVALKASGCLHRLRSLPHVTWFQRVVLRHDRLSRLMLRGVLTRRCVLAAIGSARVVSLA